jgi:hypothetical protein
LGANTACYVSINELKSNGIFSIFSALEIFMPRLGIQLSLLALVGCMGVFVLLQESHAKETLNGNCTLVAVGNAMQWVPVTNSTDAGVRLVNEAVCRSAGHGLFS